MMILKGNGYFESWDVQKGTRKSSHLIQIDVHNVVDSAVSNDGKELLVGLSTGIAQLWDVDAGLLINEYSTESSIDKNSFLNTQVAFSPDTKKILVGLSDEAIYLWDVETGEQRTYNHSAQ